MKRLYVNPIQTGLFWGSVVPAGGDSPSPFPSFISKLLMVWQITMANLSLITNDINLK